MKNRDGNEYKNIQMLTEYFFCVQILKQYYFFYQ